MDDISTILSSLSGDDIDKLKNLANSFLGGGEDNSEPPPEKHTQQNHQSTKQPNALSDLFGGEMNFGTDEIKMLMKAKQAMEKFNNSSNDNANLILALKPHLSEERQGRADEAIKIMKMLDMLPMIKDFF